MLHDSSIANRFCLPSPRSRMSPSKPKPRLPKLVIQQDNSPFSIGPDVSHVEMCRTFPARKHDGTPVQILPHLYLGNACHSSSWETLKGLGITAVMNVSRRCVNHFPLQLKYKNIPVEDDTDSDLSGWFHDATAFIDSVQKEGGRVLVHCKAGISRSATICMSYLMISHAMRVEDAFEFVHRIRAIIAPNLAFMLQLHVLEKDLLTSRANDDDVIDANEVVEPSEQSSCCLVRSMSVPCAIVNCEKEETDHLTTPCLALSSGYVSRSNHFPSSEHCFDHFTSPHHVYHQIASPS